MLYTTYFSKINLIPDTAIKLIITRYPPKWLNVNNYSNLHISKSLSPSEDLLLTYKKTDNWSSYVTRFTAEMETRSDLVEGLARLHRLLLKGKDVYLICYEKDYLHCHRYLIAEYFKNLGFAYAEL